MKKFIAIIAGVIAIATISVLALRANAATPETSNELATVNVVVSQGNKIMFSMTGMDCATIYSVLPSELKAQIISEWNMFSKVAKTEGTYSGVKYSFQNGFSAKYQGYTVTATNVTPELIHKVLSSE